MTRLAPIELSDAPAHPEIWPPEIALVAAAGRHDRAALEVLLTATFPKVAGFFGARGCTRDEASELASETLIRIVENLPQLRNYNAYRTWCWRLAETVFREWIRSKKKSARAWKDPVDTHQPTPEDEYEAYEEEKRVARAFATLDPEEQTLLWLRHVEGLSYADVAQVRGSSVGAARVAAHRANKRLTELFEQLK
ncbi:MAG: RNA polymerase sigma factor [Actinomycetota bacterium]